MKHVTSISIRKRAMVQKAVDPAGAAFLEVWAAVMGTILFGAFGGKE